MTLNLVTDLLAATADQHAAKHRADRLRAALYAKASADYTATGIAPTWKMKGSGAIRLDGVDPDPKPYVSDPDLFGSWLLTQPQHAAKVTVTITIPAVHLATAQAVLSTVLDTDDVRTGSLEHPTHVLTDVLANAAVDDTLDGTPAVVVDTTSGEVIPGLGARAAANPRLVVSLDRDYKLALEDAVDQTIPADLDQPVASPA